MFVVTVANAMTGDSVSAEIDRLSCTVYDLFGSEANLFLYVIGDEAVAINYVLTRDVTIHYVKKGLIFKLFVQIDGVRWQLDDLDIDICGYWEIETPFDIVPKMTKTKYGTALRKFTVGEFWRSALQLRLESQEQQTSTTLARKISENVVQCGQIRRRDILHESDVLGQGDVYLYFVFDFDKVVSLKLRDPGYLRFSESKSEFEELMANM